MAGSHLVRRLFEKAVANTLRLQLRDLGWQVKHGRKLSWPIAQSSDGITEHLPGMQTDIELVHVGQRCKLAIDTKFTHIFTGTQYKTEVLRSSYLHQLYAYLRTQEEELPANDTKHSEGRLLHPQRDKALDAYVAARRYKNTAATSGS